MKKQVILVLHTLMTISITLLLVVFSPYNSSKISNKRYHFVFINNEMQFNEEWNSKAIQNSFSIYASPLIIERLKIKGLLRIRESISKAIENIKHSNRTNFENINQLK